MDHAYVLGNFCLISVDYEYKVKVGEDKMGVRTWKVSRTYADMCCNSLMAERSFHLADPQPPQSGGHKQSWHPGGGAGVLHVLDVSLLKAVILHEDPSNDEFKSGFLRWKRI